MKHFLIFQNTPFITQGEKARKQMWDVRARSSDEALAEYIRRFPKASLGFAVECTDCAKCAAA